MNTKASNTPEKTACIIVAGGSGTRFGGEEPKQFMPLAGEPLFTWSVKFFGNHALINQVILVVASGWMDRAAELLNEVSLPIPLKLVAGGSRRQDSVLAGLVAAEDASIVVIQDGARPFPPDTLQDAIAASRNIGGAIYAVPATDSIKLVEQNMISKTVPRAGLWAAQTPQIFDRQKLLEALEDCNRQGIELTDDASAFEHMGWPVAIVSGSRLNLKITYPEDFIMAEAILKGRKE